MGLTLGLFAIGVAAIIIEFFVPTFGVVGIVGLGSIVGGIVLAFARLGTFAGVAFLIGALIVVPAVVAVFFRLFPRTFVGRRLILGSASEHGAVLPELKGRKGLTLTVMRPSGMVNVDGRRISAVTGGEFLERGQNVVVTHVEGARVVVRALPGASPQGSRGGNP